MKVRVRGQRNNVENRRHSNHRRKQPQAIVRRRMHQPKAAKVIEWVKRGRQRALERYWSNPEAFRAVARDRYHKDKGYRDRKIKAMRDYYSKNAHKYAKTQALLRQARCKAAKAGGSSLEHLDIEAFKKVASKNQIRLLELRLTSQAPRSMVRPRGKEPMGLLLAEKSTQTILNKKKVRK